MSLPCPRYSTVPFPPYSYVPGHFPHPVSDAKGHMYGKSLAVPEPLEPDAWMDCQEYLYGIDLFNHGFYWESHETWESLWHVAGRRGPIADFLKGLIKLAACTVKVREGNPRGVQRHAKRAMELLTNVMNLENSGGLYCGLSLPDLKLLCTELSGRSESEFSSPNPTLLIEKHIVLGKGLHAS